MEPIPPPASTLAIAESTPPETTGIPVVESTAPKTDLGLGYAFRNWNYTMVSVSLKIDILTGTDLSVTEHFHDSRNLPIEANWIHARDSINTVHNGCMDTGCGATLINRQLLMTQLPQVKILKMATPLKVRGIGASKHETDEYIVEPLYFTKICFGSS